MKNYEEKPFVIVRCYYAGVWAGNIEERDGEEVLLSEGAIRIWYWDGAASLSQMANTGVKKPQNCKFAQPTKNKVLLLEAKEIIFATKEAEESIKGVKSWEV